MPNVIHCIEDDFKIFLDKSYYISRSPTQCGHSRYGRIMFNHHNPLDNEQEYDYYKRCVHRFKHLLQNTEHKLFIVIYVNQSGDNTQQQIKNVIDFNNQFSNHSDPNYTLLVIFHIPNKVKCSHQFTYENNIHFLILHTLSSSTGTRFINHTDNEYLNRIIKEKYNFQDFINNS